MTLRDIYSRAVERGDYESAFAARIELTGEHDSACRMHVLRDLRRGKPKLPSVRRLGQ